jgi:hypothetical protein
METFNPRDPLFYGNPRDVASQRNGMWGDIILPIIDNLVTDQQIAEITDVPALFDVSLFVTQVRNPLTGFEFDDTHLYTTNATVATVIDEILAEFSPDVPIERNIIPPGVIDDAIAELDLCFNPLRVSTDGFRTVHPWQRRIDCRFPAIGQEYFETVVLPLEDNVTALDDISAIIRCLESPAFQMEFLEFPLEDAEALGHFEAPADGDEDLTALSWHVIALIMRADITPFVPVVAELHGREIGFVLDDVISEFLAVEGVDWLVSDMRVDRVHEVSGPVEIPKFIRPENIVTDLLWDFLLPQLPIRATEIDDIIDRLTIEEAGEPPSNEVEMLLTKYGARGGA